MTLTATNAPATPTPGPVRPVRGRPDRRPTPGGLLVTVGLGLFFLYSVAPVWWLVVSATKSVDTLYNSNGLWFADAQPAANVAAVVGYRDGIYYTWLGNTLLYAGVGAAVCTVVSVAAGYGLSKFEFRGRSFGLALVVGSFLVPGALLTVPLYLVFARLGLLDTVWAVLIPTFVSPFGVYLAKVYADTAIPTELIDAARIDGAGELRIFTAIVMRLMTTGAATIFVLTFVGSWNGFFLPLIMLRGSEKWTLALGLYSWLQSGTDQTIDLTALTITGALLSTLPLLLFVVSMQRYWRSGLTVGALK